MSDNLWTVVKPRNGDAEAIAEMNTKLLAFDPNTPARHDPECRKIARSLMETERPSFAEMVRRGMEGSNDNYPNQARRERDERLEERQLDTDMRAQAAEDKAYADYLERKASSYNQDCDGRTIELHLTKYNELP